VLELFFQVFDKGVMEDGEGVQIDFKNTVILLTSNAAQDVITDACSGSTWPDAEQLVERLRPVLLQQFSPAFLGRLAIIPYYPLGDAHIHAIVNLKLHKLAARFSTNHHTDFSWNPSVSRAIAARCTEVDSGARNVDHILSHSVLPELSRQVLERISMGHPFREVHMEVDAQGDFCFHFRPETLV
jgi:type VI secretion system protein VasG